MHYYRLFTQRVACEQKLGRLPRIEKGPCALRVRKGRIVPTKKLDWYHHARDHHGHRFASFARLGKGYLIRMHGTADFLLSGTGRMVEWFGEPDEHHLQAQLLSFVIPLALTLQGRQVLHACAVKMGDGAVIFMGKQGMGKSTLTAACIRAGFAALSDDSLPLLRRGAKIHALPSVPEVRLSKHGIKHFFGQEKLTTAVRAFRKKRAYLPEHYVQKYLPVRAVFVLERWERLQVKARALSPQEAWTNLLGNSYRIDPWHKLRIRREADFFAYFTENVPIFSLIYPRKLELLHRVISCAEKALKKSN